MRAGQAESLRLGLLHLAELERRLSTLGNFSDAVVEGILRQREKGKVSDGRDKVILLASARSVPQT